VDHQRPRRGQQATPRRGRVVGIIEFHSNKSTSLRGPDRLSIRSFFHLLRADHRLVDFCLGLGLGSPPETSIVSTMRRCRCPPPPVATSLVGTLDAPARPWAETPVSCMTHTRRPKHFRRLPIPGRAKSHRQELEAPGSSSPPRRPSPAMRCPCVRLPFKCHYHNKSRDRI